MADTLKLDIVTPTGPIANASGVEVPGVEVPGILGEMGVLPRCCNWNCTKTALMPFCSAKVASAAQPCNVGMVQRQQGIHQQRAP